METNNFIVVGKNAVLEQLNSAPDKVDTVYLLDKMQKNRSILVEHCKQNGVKFQFVPEKKLAQLTDLKHQGVVARIFSPGFWDETRLLSTVYLSPLPLILGFDQIQDSGNIGTLARTLFCLEGSGIVITKNRSAFLGDRVSKASAGAVSRLPISRVTNMARFLRQCQEKDIYIYHTNNDPSSQNIFQTCLKLPAILVLGNENKGVRPGVAKECHFGLRVPLTEDFDSMNVAQAGAILLGEFFRQHFYSI